MDKPRPVVEWVAHRHFDDLDASRDYGTGFGREVPVAVNLFQVNTGGADTPPEGVVAQAGVKIHPDAEDARLFGPSQGVEVLVAAIGGSRPRSGSADVCFAIVFDREGVTQGIGKHHGGGRVFYFPVEDIGSRHTGIDNFQRVADNDLLPFEVTRTGV